MQVLSCRCSLCALYAEAAPPHAAPPWRSMSARPRKRAQEKSTGGRHGLSTGGRHGAAGGHLHPCARHTARSRPAIPTTSLVKQPLSWALSRGCRGSALDHNFVRGSEARIRNRAGYGGSCFPYKGDHTTLVAQTTGRIRSHAVLVYKQAGTIANRAPVALRMLPCSCCRAQPLNLTLTLFLQVASSVVCLRGLRKRLRSWSCSSSWRNSLPER